MNEDNLSKLSRQSGEGWKAYSHPRTFMTEITNNGSSRLVVGVPDGDSSIFAKLVDCLEPPCFLLYILHTPRGEGEPGRYQSPSINFDELHSFLDRFSDFFVADARYDLWAYSPSEKATVVWDRHNLIYAYGPIEQFCSTLKSLGFDSGTPGISFPHQHHYREEFDFDAKELLSTFEWSYTPLRPEDEQ